MSFKTGKIGVEAPEGKQARRRFIEEVIAADPRFKLRWDNKELLELMEYSGSSVWAFGYMPSENVSVVSTGGDFRTLMTPQEFLDHLNFNNR
jgi:hypothetical protein